ncbi:heme biosynthesis protein HemY [Ramlibacter rhizophilus]|uniref:Heme biosynthesis protein HemY n=1 Tax=Ramlibacter rhizophilus TaxID=1781167 RepID=A0A4Z0BCU8_9BURK|nr:heme biosynthesis HemY N-terminal domain-containing protein [Ramlibacter rhizophilus]TFY96521.1 heme biosynthesis protein HemY [Ramlibacter rhizophilus]
MRAALWLLALFGVAVAIALFAGNNQGTVTLFWPPWRIDLSLNLVLLLLLAGFVFLHAALRALSALFALPRQALRWRNQQKERAMHALLVDATAHLMAGRFVRARKAAEAALVQEQSLASAGEKVGHAGSLRALAHVLAAESAQALQDRAAREHHLQLALDPTALRDAPAMREGALMRAARWALDERDPQAAEAWLRELPQGAARRTLALRMKLKAARLAGHTEEALDTARLLAKHRAFSPAAGQSIVRGLAVDLLNSAHDVGQLQRAWNALEPAERQMPELAIHASQRLLQLGGEPEQARQWLLPVWERYESLSDAVKVRLVHALEDGLESIDAQWLARIESAQRADPRDPVLQYLAGMACMKRQLWGKAQQLLTQAALGLQDAGLHRQAWRAMASLAEERGDATTAAEAWKRAANP